MSDEEREDAQPRPKPKQLSLGIAEFVETESFAQTEPVKGKGRLGARRGSATSASATTASRAKGSASSAPGTGASATADPSAGESFLSRTRQLLLREETHPQMVVVRVLEDAKWAQGRLRQEFRSVKAAGARLNVLKLYWGIRLEVVKALQDLGVLPRELFFTEEESDFDHLPTAVAETVAGLLAGRLEPQSTADGDDAA
jgi:hypothetical protein